MDVEILLPKDQCTCLSDHVPGPFSVAPGFRAAAAHRIGEHRRRGHQVHPGGSRITSRGRPRTLPGRYDCYSQRNYAGQSLGTVKGSSIQDGSFLSGMLLPGLILDLLNPYNRLCLR